MTGAVRAVEGRRNTIAAELTKAAAHAEGAGRSEDSLLMLAAACLVGEDPLLARVPEAHRDTVRRIIMPQGRARPALDRVSHAAYSPDGTRIVTVFFEKSASILDAITGAEITLLSGHEKVARLAAFSLDGTRIVTASDDETARIWDTATGAEIACLSGHGSRVSSAAFSFDGTRIVTASSDRTARIWDTATGAEIACLRGHENWLRSAAFSPDGTRIATASADNTVRVWDAATGAEINCLSGHEVTFSPDGKWIVTISDQIVRFWDAATGAEISRLRYEAYIAAFSPDGTRIVIANEDATVRVCSIAQNSEMTCLEGHFTRHAELAFSSDGKRILISAGNRTSVSDAATGVELACFGDAEYGAALSLDGNRILMITNGWTAQVQDVVPMVVRLKVYEIGESSAAFSPDGVRIVTAGYDLAARIWDAVTGEEIYSLEGHEGVLNSAAFSSDGSMIVTASDDETARLWNAETSLEIACLSGHRGNVNSAVFSPDGTRILTASLDGTARIWDAVTGTELGCLIGHGAFFASAAFSPDGSRIVTASGDATARIWDAANYAEIVCLSGHTNSVRSAAFSPDGTRIVTASSDRTARMWDTANGAEIACLTGHEYGVDGAAFSPDGTFIATASGDGTARIWNAVSGIEIARLTGPWEAVTSAAFSPDGARIVTTLENAVRIWDVSAAMQQYASIHTLPCGEGSVRAVAEAGDVLATACGSAVQLWDVVSGDQIVLLEGHDHLVRSLAFSPDGSALASASRDGSWRVWDRTGLSLLAKVGAHGGAGLWSVAFSPDGARLVTSGADGTARVWEAATGDERSVLRGHKGEVFLAAFALGGTRVVTFGEDGRAVLWDVADGRQVEVVQDGVTAVAVSPDGTRLATGHADGRIGFSSLAGGPERGLSEPCHADAVVTIEFSPDGTRVVTSSADGAVRITEVASGSGVALARSGAVVSARFSPDGRRIICAHEDGSATVHDAASGRLLARLRGHRAALTDARYVLGGMRIVTVSDDHRAIIWEGGRVGGDWGSCLSYGQRRAIMRLGLAAAGISTDMPGERIEGIDDEPDMHRQDPHAQTVRAIVRRAVAGY